MAASSNPSLVPPRLGPVTDETVNDASVNINVTANAAMLLSNLRRNAATDDDDGDSTISFGRDDGFLDDDDVDEGGDITTPAEHHFHFADHQVKALILLCRGMKADDGEELVDLQKAPWNTIDKKDKPVRADYISEIQRRWKASNPNDNRVGPRPGSWKLQQMTDWLDQNPINAPREVRFLTAKFEEIKQELIAAEVARVAESEAEAGMGLKGMIWAGLLPFLRLLHAILDVEANRAAFIARNAISNNRAEVDNRNSTVRPPTCWEVITDTVNDPGFNPKSNDMPEELHEDFMHPIDLSYERFAVYEPATPAKCQERFEDAVVKMKHCRANYGVSGQGENGIQNNSSNRHLRNVVNTDGVEVDTATRETNLLKRNFLLKYSSYVLYLWVMLEKDDNADLLLTSIEQLAEAVASSNGATGVPSLIPNADSDEDGMNISSGTKRTSTGSKKSAPPPSNSAVMLNNSIMELGEKIENVARMKAEQKEKEARATCVRDLEHRIEDLKNKKCKFELQLITDGSDYERLAAYLDGIVKETAQQIATSEAELNGLH